MGNKHNEIKEFFTIISSIEKLNENPAAAAASSAVNNAPEQSKNAPTIPDNNTVADSTKNSQDIGNDRFIRIAKLFASNDSGASKLNSAMTKLNSGQPLPIQYSELLCNTIVKKLLGLLTKDESLFQRLKMTLGSGNSAPVPASKEVINASMTNESFKKLSKYDKEILMILKPLMIEAQIASTKLNKLNIQYLKEAQIDPKIRALGVAMSGSDANMQSKLIHGLTVLATGGPDRATSDANARPALILMLSNLLNMISKNASLYGLLKQLTGAKEENNQQPNNGQQTAQNAPAQQQPAQTGNSQAGGEQQPA